MLGGGEPVGAPAVGGETSGHRRLQTAVLSVRIAATPTTQTPLIGEQFSKSVILETV